MEWRLSGAFSLVSIVLARDAECYFSGIIRSPRTKTGGLVVV